MKLIEEILKEFERLEMCDQESKGGSIVLDEWMDKDNMDIFSDFIKQTILKTAEYVTEKNLTPEIPEIDKEVCTEAYKLGYANAKKKQEINSWELLEQIKKETQV